MKPIRVLGVGSPHGDDRIGWLVAQALNDSFSSTEVSIVTLDRPGATLLHYLDGAEGVILIDALHGDQAPGTISSLSRRRLLKRTGQWSSHQGGIAEALELGCALDMLPGRLLLMGIQASHFTPYQDEISPRLQQAIPEAAARVRSELHGWLSELHQDSMTHPATGSTTGTGGR